jgi:hypothetical protein
MSLECRHRLAIEGVRYCSSVAMSPPNRKLDATLSLCAICPQRDKPGGDVELARLYEVARVHLGEPARAPSLPFRLSNYLGAMIRWAHADYPERGEQVVASILEVCRGCVHFKATSDELHACSYCGCGGVASKWTGGLVEKIRMATESCPIRKW